MAHSLLLLEPIDPVGDYFEVLISPSSLHLELIFSSEPTTEHAFVDCKILILPVILNKAHEFKFTDSGDLLFVDFYEILWQSVNLLLANNGFVEHLVSFLGCLLLV